jgi:hypothetical protein
MDFREMKIRCEINVSASRQRPLASSYEYDSENSGSVKEEFVH